MKIRMRRTTKGSPDGARVVSYEEGKTYDADKREISESLCNVFVDMGAAEAIMDKHPVHDSKQKITEPDEHKDDEAAEDLITHVGGGTYELPDGRRVRGKEAALAALAQIE